MELLRRARQHVEKAIKEKKIFSMQGPYPVIRKLLRARGWVEKKFSSTPTVEIPEPPEEEEEEEEEAQWYDEDPDGIHDMMSSVVRDQTPTLIWASHSNAVDYRQLQRDQVVNHFAGIGAFTTKEGLCVNLQNLPWFHRADPSTFFPRCYRLGAEDERQAFIEDFRLTAARSLLKLAVEKAGDMPGVMERPGKGDPDAPKAAHPLGRQQPCPSAHATPTGPAPPSPPSLLDAALQVCRMQLDSLEHRDIDQDSPMLHVTDADWDCFLREYYRVVNEQARLVPSILQQEQCRALLQQLQARLPQLHMEGDHNLWIIKPGAKSRGRGITCSARLEEVLEVVGKRVAPSMQAGQWVVQKYVERPLLILGTKFDLRQWFLVTDWNPLTVWFYRDSYVRFCSRPFSLHRLHWSQHLCNVAIQKQWRLSGGRHPKLPRDLIWSSQQFQLYLQQAGHVEAWEKVIVPGMKEAVVAALHSAQELVGSRKGSFELYGADFMFGEDCQPWLLEINTNPSMEPCSAVTRRLCTAVQRNTLHVVLDHKKNPRCSTGAFDLIYKEAIVPVPPRLGLKLVVEGYLLMKPQLQEQQPQAKLPTFQPLVRPVVPKPPVVPKSPLAPKPSAVPKSSSVPKPPLFPMSPVLPRPPVVPKSPTVPKPPFIPKPPAVPKPPVMPKHPMFPKPPLLPMPPVVPRPPAVPKPPAAPKPPVMPKHPMFPKPPLLPTPPVVPRPPAVPRPPVVPKPRVVSKPLMDTKPSVVPKPPVVSKPHVVSKPLVDTNPPVAPKPPAVPKSSVVAKPRHRTAQLPQAGVAQVKPAPRGQLRSFSSSGPVRRAPPQPNRLL
ncbi:tubulin monoglycylase TTLL3-like [Strigops habroptila]|uniref:tubulin monoglycylase TTLL3-like n=1 Tax=Strigops habroptila TaxID=2489341 RepID=UPI0011CEE4EF|nr:tubulin monoglycylase TTLL3-like [Strigops habroptila]